MAWRLKHSTPKIYCGPDRGTIEATVISDSIMEISERAARQQLSFYVEGWVDERPDGRHAYVRDGLHVDLLERPDGCACYYCERALAAAPEEADNLAWWRSGTVRPHIGSYATLKRTDKPAPRASTEQYRVVDYGLTTDGKTIEAGRQPTLHSKHFTKAEAQKGLVDAVEKWRASMRHRTATRYNSDAYNLKIDARPSYRLQIERIPS